MGKAENFTVRLDAELKRRMKDHPEINWSHVIREHVGVVLDDVERMDRLAAGSRLTEEDIHVLADAIDASAAERFRHDNEDREHDERDHGETVTGDESMPAGGARDVDAT